MEPTELIRDLENLGKTKGKSVAVLCGRAKVDRASWQRWKSGRTKPHLDTWKRLLDLRNWLMNEPSRSPDERAA